MKRRSSYKVTFFDRHGPAGAHYLKVAGYGAIVFVLGSVMFSFLAVKLGLTGLSAALFTLVAAGTLSGAAAYFGLGTGQAMADGAQYLTAGGSSTPYEEQFSQEQALVMQRDYAAALALFEQRIAATPNEPRCRIAAADLYATHGANPARAAELYREVQRIPGIASGRDIYVSNRLADMYLGPLRQPGRALVEFRRIIERYPGSPQAQHARMALANVKAHMLEDQQRGA